jgi:hypothetical protein
MTDEPMTKGTTPENLLALRTGATRLGLYATDRGVWEKVAKKNPDTVPVDPDVFKHLMEHAPTFLFNEDMQSVLEASVETMPPFALHPDDLFVPEGFVVLRHG